MIKEIITSAIRGISHPNTDLDAQTFLLRVHQVRRAAGRSAPLRVDYLPRVTAAELADPRVLIWDIGRSHLPGQGNFDHHQDHTLGATPIILLQAMGLEPTALDRYVDLADRGLFFKEPQPIPYAETLQGVAHGINLVHAEDAVRSRHFQDLLGWIEGSGSDPFGRFDEANLPLRFHPFVAARRREDQVALEAAAEAQWYETRLGPIAYIASDAAAVMRMLYGQGAVLVVLHEPEGHMSHWQMSAPKYTVGANPALVSVPDQLDLRPLFTALSSLEPSGNTWGGQAGVGGSPREEGGSALAPSVVIKAVREYL
ncbi:MAG: hypothetical protein ACM3XM_16420 [Mycobacterium leprae]